MPGFLRKLCPVHVSSVADGKTNSATFYATPDYLAVGSDEDAVAAGTVALPGDHADNVTGRHAAPSHQVTAAPAHARNGPATARFGRAARPRTTP